MAQLDATLPPASGPVAALAMEQSGPTPSPAPPAPLPATGAAAPRCARRRPRTRRTIPDSILNDPDLAAAAAALPPNYSFEIHKTIWRLREAEPPTRRVAIQGRARIPHYQV